MQDLKLIEMNIVFPTQEKLNIVEVPNIKFDDNQIRRQVYVPENSNFIRFEQTSIGTMIIQSGINPQLEILNSY